MVEHLTIPLIDINMKEEKDHDRYLQYYIENISMEIKIKQSNFIKSMLKYMNYLYVHECNNFCCTI